MLNTFIDENIQVTNLAAGEYIAALNDGNREVSREFIIVRSKVCLWEF
ncbi:MAG: hypothetical protein ABIT08_12555 [Bacteroidia bacterium]